MHWSRDTEFPVGLEYQPLWVFKDSFGSYPHWHVSSQSGYRESAERHRNQRLDFSVDCHHYAWDNQVEIGGGDKRTIDRAEVDSCRVWNGRTSDLNVPCIVNGARKSNANIFGCRFGKTICGTCAGRPSGRSVCLPADGNGLRPRFRFASSHYRLVTGKPQEERSQADCAEVQ